ncbi:MAG: hypothetical protein KKE44_12405 [Proteobacteria bacterium]|nr:hypothetical protein [Pseudomonadota bacterium]MBU1583528.1 hypothetical protein [Pseudomonadota bacterium]MBU2454972.1 hypothetical protein [Pseudomonadota bacterium]MBU2631093.1 hypothetical protein [Pseudomonadota bacterium]
MKHSNDKAVFLGRVTASVTHEIQNVLAIIKETSGLMEDFLQMNQSEGLSDIEDRLNKCIETIKRQAYRGVTLTSSLNGFAHTPDSTLSSINIFETLKKLVFITDRLFKQKGVDVSIVECNNPYSITTDPVLFEMVVFSCTECLIDVFQIKTTLILNLQSSGDQTAIKFSYADDDLKYENFKQKIIQSVQWINICELCKQINIKAEVSTDIPGILLFFK